MPSTLLENLPNVFIRNIVLDNNTETTNHYRIVLDVVVNTSDIDQSKTRWIDDDFLLKYLNLIVVKSSNKEFNEAVSSGQVSINTPNINQYSSYSGDIVLKSLPLVQKVKKIRTPEALETTPGHLLFTLEFDQDSLNDNVDIYAMTGVNIVDISSHFGVDLRSDGINAYHGPIVSESIFKNGSVVRETNYLTLPNGDPYSGPFHSHPNLGYMVGSRHTEGSHPTLTVTRVPNTKLKDNRITSHPNKPTAITPVLRNTSIFSSLETTHDSNRVLSGIFSVNVNNILLTKSKYGRLLLNLSPEIYGRLLDNFRIRHLKISKKKVKQHKNKKTVSQYLSKESLIESKDEQDTLSLVNYAKIRSLYEKPHNVMRVRASDISSDTFQTPFGTHSFSDHRIESSITERPIQLSDTAGPKYVRTFVFTDSSRKPKYAEKCMYEVDIKLSDPSISLMQEVVQEIQTSISSLERYISISLKRKNYDFKSKKLKENYLRTLLDLPENQPWINAPAVYGKYYSLLKNISTFQRDEIVKRYYNFLSPNSFNVKSAKLFLFEFKNLSCMIMRYFKISNNQMQNLVSQRSQKIFQNVNFTDIDVSHEFSNIVDFRHLRAAFNYFNASLSTPSFPIFTISKEQYWSRIQMEISRLPTANPAGEHITARLAPLSFSANSAFFNLAKMDPIHYTELVSYMQNEGFGGVPPEEPNGSFYQEADTNTSTTPSDVLQGTISDWHDYMPAADYIGSTFGSLSADEKLQEYPPSAYSQATSTANTTSPSPYGADPMETILFPDPPEDPPMHEKAYLDTIQNTLVTPDNKNIMTVMFFCLQQVQYMPRRTSVYSSMKEQTWTTLTKSAFNSLRGDVLCRMRPFLSVMLPNISVPQAYHSYNNTFIIRFPTEESPNVTAITPSAVEMMTAHDAAANLNNDYMISNLIAQPVSRDGVNAGFQYSRMAIDNVPGGDVGNLEQILPQPMEAQSINASGPGSEFLPAMPGETQSAPPSSPTPLPQGSSLVMGSDQFVATPTDSDGGSGYGY